MNQEQFDIYGRLPLVKLASSVAAILEWQRLLRDMGGGQSGLYGKICQNRITYVVNEFLQCLY